MAQPGGIGERCRLRCARSTGISLARRGFVGAAGSPPCAEADGGRPGTRGLGGCQHRTAVRRSGAAGATGAEHRSANNDLFATASVLHGYAAGVLVRHDVGRPIKVEGNPQHPASLGATDVFAQAQLLGFYDPDRAVGLERKGGRGLAERCRPQWRTSAPSLGANHGEGLRILTGTITSPTLARQINALQQAIPQCAGINGSRCRATMCAAAHLAYGRAVESVPNLECRTCLCDRQRSVEFRAWPFALCARSSPRDAIRRARKR